MCTFLAKPNPACVPHHHVIPFPTTLRFLSPQSQAKNPSDSKARFKHHPLSKMFPESLCPRPQTEAIFLSALDLYDPLLVAAGFWCHICLIPFKHPGAQDYDLLIWKGCTPQQVSIENGKLSRAFLEKFKTPSPFYMGLGILEYFQNGALYYQVFC